MSIKIYQFDAFTSRPFAGNPAAVCLLPGAVDAEWMQQVALEMNCSETAFLVARSDGDFDLRWFTPACEVDLCGHATLGSAHVLWEAKLLDTTREARFHTRSGLLTARRVNGWIEMDFPAEPARSAETPQGMLEALGLDTAVYVGRNRMDFLVEIAEDSDLRRLRPDYGPLSQVEARGVIVTSRSADPAYDFVSRFFAPQSGINEDPVTGSAHCCLAPYWSRKLGKTELRAFQASPRGGEMTLRLSGDRVLLIGQSVTVLTAELADSVSPKTAQEADERKTYQQKAQDQFDRLGTRIDDLLGKVETKARSGYQRVAEEIREKRGNTGAKLSELKSSSGEAWKELKPGFEKAWQDLRQAFEKAVEAFGR